MILILKKLTEDTGNCRVYYRGVENKRLYCQLLNLDGTPDDSFMNSWFDCTESGEPNIPLKKDLIIEITK